VLRESAAKLHVVVVFVFARVTRPGFAMGVVSFVSLNLSQRSRRANDSRLTNDLLNASIARQSSEKFQFPLSRRDAVHKKLSGNSIVYSCASHMLCTISVELELPVSELSKWRQAEIGQCRWQ
jgi:hypothetical protein